MMAQSINNQSQFDTEVLSSKQLVVCIFWVGFCHSCNQMHSVYQSAETRFGDSVRFFSVNIEENQKLGDDAGILVVPTVVFYKNGRAVNRVFGLQNEDKFASLVEDVIIGQ